MPPANRKRRSTRARTIDTSTWTEEERQAQREKELLKTPVAEMELSVRVINTLEQHNCILAGDVVRQTYAGLMSMKNFGEKTLAELRVAVRALGLTPPSWRKPPRPKKTARPVSRVKSILSMW